jgi:Nucleotidyl transferase of unknown function (DUF2204)
VAQHRTEWAEQIPPDEWKVYGEVIAEAQARGIPFALGGAFAVASYTGCWRDTKDLDVYVLPEHREEMLEVLAACRLEDYYSKMPYDRWWIYRSFRGDVIVDMIWAMANHRAQIDKLWMSGPEIELRGRRVRVLPPEAMIWDKLYIMQRDRCDWPDVLNLLYAAADEVQWEYLVRRMGEDTPLLAGALSVFRWISPGRARQLPAWLWSKLGLAEPGPETENVVKRRTDLLDRRPWYVPDLQRMAPAA